MTNDGRLELIATNHVDEQLKASIMINMTKITILCEILKQEEGMPANEGIRIRQWERLIVQSMESLCYQKMYCTLQDLHSFARLLSMFLPPSLCTILCIDGN